MFRILSRLFFVLAALMALRLFFRAVRRMNRDRKSPDPAKVGRSEPVRPPARVAGRPPRIDRAAAEDVPYVEVEPEHARRS
ncbi:MAG TPA: hypothetical protein VFS09_00225 [Candidatus Eisenbacteria bacterium]|nr:hypothetical protein [Candidatus Eisenbacteria bacterium]